MSTKLRQFKSHDIDKNSKITTYLRSHIGTTHKNKLLGRQNLVLYYTKILMAHYVLVKRFNIFVVIFLFWQEWYIYHTLCSFQRTNLPNLI